MSAPVAYIVSWLVSSHWQHSVAALESSAQVHAHTRRPVARPLATSSGLNMLLCSSLYGCNSYMTCLGLAVAIPLNPFAEELVWQLPAAHALLHGTSPAM